MVLVKTLQLRWPFLFYTLITLIKWFKNKRTWDLSGNSWDLVEQTRSKVIKEQRQRPSHKIITLHVLHIGSHSHPGVLQRECVRPVIFAVWEKKITFYPVCVWSGLQGSLLPEPHQNGCFMAGFIVMCKAICGLKASMRKRWSRWPRLLSPLVVSRGSACGQRRSFRGWKGHPGWGTYQGAASPSTRKRWGGSRRTTAQQQSPLTAPLH